MVCTTIDCNFKPPHFPKHSTQFVQTHLKSSLLDCSVFQHIVCVCVLLTASTKFMFVTCGSAIYMRGCIFGSL